MANKTVYPYGTEGSLPSSIGLVNDIVTGGVNKALAAEQGKVIVERTSFKIPLDLSAVQTNEGAILSDGTIQQTSFYVYTEPVFLSKGGIYRITYYGGGAYAPVSLTDENASYYQALYIDGRITASENTILVNVLSPSYVAFSYAANQNFLVEFTEEVKDMLVSNYEYGISVQGKYIDRECQLQNSTNYVISEPIKLLAGETITVNTNGGLCTIIASCDKLGNLLESLVFSEYSDGTLRRSYNYKADNDMYVMVCGGRTSLRVFIYNEISGITTRLANIEDNIMSYHCGIYLYPFRAIVGKAVTIYKESVVSGLRPLYNYTVQTNFNLSDPVDDFAKYSFRLKPTSVGTTPLTVVATDEFNNQIIKTVNVECKAMPSVKMSSSEGIDVMFIGDSIVGFNGNLIGGEWKRMLATNDSESHVDEGTKAVQLPTYNVCPNKLNLVGEQLGSVSGVRYCYVNSLGQILTGKRTTNYNPNVGDHMNGSMNPFYNKNSSNPDTVGPDGFNQRVDFQWYFENACGSGKYPKLFYIALGANDIYQTYNWRFDGVEPTTDLLLKVIKKIKSVCDTMAGGESGIKIKVFNHQTYPLYNMFGYEFPLLQQRLVWNRLYDSYYKAITDPLNGVSGYTEFVDCASKFDWRVGYTKETIATNARYDGLQDEYIAETCHMNNVGAYNYADALIDDFLADSDFD